MEVPTGYGILGTFLRPRAGLAAGRQQSMPHFETRRDNHAQDCQLLHRPPFQSDGPGRDVRLQVQPEPEPQQEVQQGPEPQPEAAGVPVQGPLLV